MNGLRPGKQFSIYQGFIASIKRNEKSIILGPDYVVLSKNAYEAIIDYHQPKLITVMYDEIIMTNWIQEQFMRREENGD